MFLENGFNDFFSKPIVYHKLEKTMRELGKSFIDEYLYDIETAGIHSYRSRIKGKMQLLEKIIRKKKQSLLQRAVRENLWQH